MTATTQAVSFCVKKIHKLPEDAHYGLRVPPKFHDPKKKLGAGVLVATAPDGTRELTSQHVIKLPSSLDETHYKNAVEEKVHELS